MTRNRLHYGDRSFLAGQTTVASLSPFSRLGSLSAGRPSNRLPFCLAKPANMASHVPSVTFKNGHSIPIIGLGTWKSRSGEVTNAVKEAIACGYRHIDCAKAYENEAEVGAAIKAKIEDGTVKREDLFVTSKLWIQFTKKEQVIPALKEQLKSMGLSYLDLYLIHWPASLQEADVLFPVDENGKARLADNDFVNTWRGMEECLREGLVKSIGVSNFTVKQLERLLSVSEIPPVNNQIECHPYLTQEELVNFCKSKGIVITAYSPLGSPDRPLNEHPDYPILLQDPVVKRLAEKYKKSPAQILLKFHVQNGNVVIPKSATPTRIKSNFEIFDFVMSPTDLKSLKSLDKGLRYICFGFIKDHPEYPFKDE